MKTNIVYYKSSTNMENILSNSIDLIITSPPYFNIKDYTKGGKQKKSHSKKKNNDMGAYKTYKSYISNLLRVWKECERVLRPNGKIIINVPLIPMIKKNFSTHYNRHIFDLQSDIQNSILENTKLYLLDIYIWNRTNPTKKLMFGSYPYPSNFYAQNTIEFVTVYVKDGPSKKVSKTIKDKSKLTQKEWSSLTKQVWNIPIPNKGDIAFGKHCAIMPEEIVRRSIKLYSFVDDIILDPFTGSGTTLKVAKELNRRYIGFELYENYETIINKKLMSVDAKK